MHKSWQQAQRAFHSCRMTLQEATEAQPPQGSAAPKPYTLVPFEVTTGLGVRAHLARSSRKPRGARRATAIMAQFQKKGAVEKRADTVGTRRRLEGRLHLRQVVQVAGGPRMGGPKSTSRGRVIGGIVSCTHSRRKRLSNRCGRLYIG